MRRTAGIRRETGQRRVPAILTRPTDITKASSNQKRTGGELPVLQPSRRAAPERLPHEQTELNAPAWTNSRLRMF